MGEWLKPAVLKTVSGVTRSGFESLFPPPDSFSYEPPGELVMPPELLLAIENAGRKNSMFSVNRAQDDYLCRQSAVQS
jgi:hypothetical protein